MKEQLITFETAVLAKEKGFDLEFCNVGWHGDFGDLKGDNYPFLGTYSFYKSIYCNNKDEHQIQRPRQSLLQKWLREVHEIYVYSEHDLNPKGNGILYHTNWGFINNPTTENRNDWYRVGGGYSENEEFKTYEEALEVGLQEALKLIENEGRS
jgi:hypothetical protein